jgi:hypothetical protein
MHHQHNGNSCTGKTEGRNASANRVFQCDQLLSTIGSFLPVSEVLLSASKASKQWHAVLQRSDAFWRFHPLIVSDFRTTQSHPLDSQSYDVIDSRKNIGYRIAVANSTAINREAQAAVIRTLDVQQLRLYCYFVSVSAAEQHSNQSALEATTETMLLTGDENEVARIQRRLTSCEDKSTKQRGARVPSTGSRVSLSSNVPHHARPTTKHIPRTVWVSVANTRRCFGSACK